MSESGSGDSFSSMDLIKKLTLEAMLKLTNSHRHKDLSFPDCVECQIKQYLEKIQLVASGDSNGKVQSNSSETLFPPP